MAENRGNNNNPFVEDYLEEDGGENGGGCYEFGDGRGIDKYVDPEEAKKRRQSFDVKEQIVEAIGGFGKWQRNKCVFIVAIIWMPASFHLLKMVFYRAETDFWCSDGMPDGIGVEEWRNHTMAAAGAGGGNGENGTASCLVPPPYPVQDNILLSALDENFEVGEKCANFDYDRSFWKRTIVQEWDLVCERRGMQKWTQQVTFFGLLVGVIVSGLISDRFGRVRAMMFLLTMIIVSGTATAFSNNYYLFLLGTWGTGFSTIGYGTVMYCWMMELLAGKWKTFFGCVPHLNFAFWGLVTALIAYFLPDWHKMELVFSVPLVVLYVTYWMLPESPRWLLTHGRTGEAEAILQKIGEYNGKPIHPSFKLVPHHHESGKGLLGVLELFKTPNLRKKTLIVYYMWFATAVVYYGLTLNSNAKGSLFTYFCLGKAMEFPAIALVIFCLLKTGRRITLILLFGICGTSLILTYFVPEDVSWLRVMLNVFGRGSSNGCLCLCYVYSAEVYPTVIRNVGLGSSSFWARVGPMIAPYIADLAGFDPKLPLVVFGLISLIACLLVTFLPETAHHKLPDTVKEGEEMGKGDTFYSYIRQKFSKKL